MASSSGAVAIVACALALGAAGCRKTTVTNADPGPLPAGKVAVLHTHGCELRASVVPERARFGMEIHPYLTFRVSTDCDRKLTLLVGEAGNELGRPDSYSVSAVDSEGTSVQIRQLGGGEGSASSGHTDLSRDKPLVTRLVVRQWFTFERPGRYEVTVSKDLMIGERVDGGVIATEEWLPVKVSTFLDVDP